MDKAGLLDRSFNPYKGNHETAYNDRRMFHSSDNPGFATVVQNIGNGFSNNVNGILHNEKYYGRITGLFNEDFTRFHSRFRLFHHEGVDLRGNSNTPVVSLIHARVLAYGWWDSYGNTMFLENINTKGIYLLAHLTRKTQNLEPGMIVEPGTEVARAGNTSTVRMYPHLHVSYYHYRQNIEEEEILVRNGDNNNLIVTERWGRRPRDEWIRDPLNHSVVQKPNILR